MTVFNSALKARIRERDGHHCARCGRGVPPGWGSVHHRKPRGVLGPNIPANLVLLCGHATEPGTCHEWAESKRLEAKDDGWLLESWQDPSTTGVKRDGAWWQPGESWALTDAPPWAVDPVVSVTVSPDLSLHVEDEEETT